MSKRAILNKVTAVLEKQAKSTGAGLSFTIIIETPTCEIRDPAHPDYTSPALETTTIRTRGYQPSNDQDKHPKQRSQPINPQNEDTSNEPTP